MTITEIEQAVRKQLPFRKEQHLFLRTNGQKDSLADSGMLVICGLCSVFITGAEEELCKYYDIDKKAFKRYVAKFNAHLSRVGSIMESYGIDLKKPNVYKEFSKAFWREHNKHLHTSTEDAYKVGWVLSDVLSSRKEYRSFLKSEESIFNEDSFTSFFVYNKSQLAKNLLLLRTESKVYVDLLDFGY